MKTFNYETKITKIYGVPVLSYETGMRIATIEEIDRFIEEVKITQNNSK
jgi:hypothetical protein